MSNETTDRKPHGRLILSTADALAEEGVSFLRKLLDGCLAALGIGKQKGAKPESGPTDTGTRLARERTDLALNRTYLAAERTLQAWVRTSLSMISFGFTIGKIGQALTDVEVKVILRGMRAVGVESIAHALVILGTLSLLAADVQFAARVHDLCAQGLRRQVSIAFMVSLVLVLLGGFAFSALVMNL